MSDGLYLCQKEIRRLRGVVRTYEAQMRELDQYLEQMAEKNDLGAEEGRTIQEISDFWQQIRED